MTTHAPCGGEHRLSGSEAGRMLSAVFLHDADCGTIIVICSIDDWLDR